MVKKLFPTQEQVKKFYEEFTVQTITLASQDAYLNGEGQLDYSRQVEPICETLEVHILEKNGIKVLLKIKVTGMINDVDVIRLLITLYSNVNYDREMFLYGAGLISQPMEE